MDDAAMNVNISLEQEFFDFYHRSHMTVLHLVSEFSEGEISENELVAELQSWREKALIQESDQMTKFEYLKRHYQVGGTLRAWYSRLAR